MGEPLRATLWPCLTKPIIMREALGDLSRAFPIFTPPLATNPGGQGGLLLPCNASRIDWLPG